MREKKRKKWLFGAAGFLCALACSVSMPQRAEAAVADGTYSIDGYLKSATADKSSMGDAALVKPMNSGMDEQEQKGVTVPSKADTRLAPTPWSRPKMCLLRSGGK